MAAIDAHLVRSEMIHGFLDKRNLGLAIAGFTFFNLFVRWYQAVYGWAVGLDAFAPEFETYWMSWLFIEVVTWVVLFSYIGAFLWKTRTRDMDALTSHEILERHFHHLVWLVAYGIAIYWGASFYTEQDATWHQAVIHDTEFTPSHIIQFYTSYPIYIITGWGAFMYARTRIPCFSKGVSLPYLVVTVGPFMILPNLGLDAWAHTFWWMEELFVAPLHYGFVFFGWMALGLCGLLCQIFDDIGGLVLPTLKQPLDFELQQLEYEIVAYRQRLDASARNLSVTPQVLSQREGRLLRGEDVMHIEKPVPLEMVDNLTEGFEDFNDPPLWGQDPRGLEKRFGIKIEISRAVEVLNNPGDSDNPPEWLKAYRVRVSGSSAGIGAFRKEYLSHPPPCLSQIG